MKEKQNSMAGQMTLADLLGEDNQEAGEFRIRMPKLPEYSKEELLQYEKEALGFYLSGHPLDAYRAVMEANVSATSADFRRDDETGTVPLRDQQKVTIGGILTEMQMKTTRKQQQMAFLQLEDRMGTVEVVVFPKTFQTMRALLELDAKLFIEGHVDGSGEKDSKLIADRIYTFAEAPKELWLQLQDKNQYFAQQQALAQLLRAHPGEDGVAIYLRQEKAVKRLDRQYAVQLDPVLMESLGQLLGEKNVRVSYKVLKKVQN